MSDDLYAAFAATLEHQPDRTIFRLPEGADWTAADLLAEAGRLRAALNARGIGQGDRVAVQVAKSPAAVALYLAVLSSGALYLPLNTAYTAEEVAYIRNDAAPGAVIADPELAAAETDQAVIFDMNGEGGLSTVSGDGPPRPALQSGDPAAILYTSGTTGQPKGAVLTHGNLLSNARTLYAAWRFQPDDVLLHALPIFHAHGLFVALNCALLGAHPMIFLDRFEARTVIDRLPEATVYMGVPTHYTRLLADSRLDRARCGNMRLFVSGSAPLPAPAFEAFRDRTGHEILERYGMTETAMNTANPYEGPRKPGSVGPALPGIEVRITAESGAALPAGAIGYVEVRGPNVFSSYWQRQDATDAAFRSDGFFITGDMGYLDEGEYLHLVGRAKEVIISGGYNVYPAEVEAVLLAQDAVSDAAVFGVGHDDLGEAVAAAVVPAASGDVDPAALTAALRPHLAGYKIPKRIFVAESLPRNTMGKVLKSALQERFAGAFTAGA